MSQIVPSSSNEEMGNTKTISKTKQVSPSIKWCFTLNNYTEEDCSSIVLTINTYCRYGIVGKEIGESGTPHLQGYIEFNKKSRPIGIFNNKSIHFEKALGTREQNVDYCSKDEDILIHKGKKKDIKIIENLYPYQKYIEKIILEEPDPRKIYWFYEGEGNAGKSSFIKYSVVKYNALFCSGGKYADIMNLVFNSNIDENNIILFDIPRCNKDAQISYASIESIKNGLVCNTKYETGTKVFNAPHIVIFANYPPDVSKLSKDRWEIYKITEDKNYEQLEIMDYVEPE